MTPEPIIHLACGSHSNMKTSRFSVNSMKRRSIQSVTDTYFSIRYIFLLILLRAAQKLNMASKQKSRKSRKRKEDAEGTSVDGPVFSTNFSGLIMRSPPQAPPSLFKNTMRRADSYGKVRMNFFYISLNGVE